MRLPDPARLAQQLRRTAALLEDHGTVMLQRTADWTAPPRQGEGHRWTRGGGITDPDQPDDDDDHREEQRVTRYNDELTSILARVDADTARLEALQRIVMPAAPHRIGTTDMQAAQLAADGWCVSCARDRDGQGRPFLEPVKTGVYADACDWCGRWRAANNGQDPPVEFVRYRHASGNKRITTKVADAILRRTA